MCSQVKIIRQIPVFGRTISLPPVLEPIADLRGGEARCFRQFPLLAGRGIRISSVPVPKHAPGLFLEAVRHLLAVPDRSGQRKLASYAILSCNSNILGQVQGITKSG